MNFRLRSNNFNGKGSAKRFFAIFLLFVVIVLFFSFSVSRNFLFGTASPFWGIRNSISSFFADNIQVLKSKSELIKENNSLKLQISANKENDALLDILRKENDDLKNVLNRKDQGQKQILASILVKPFLSPYDTLIIDVGSSSGITVGDEVLALGDTHIGYVSEVYNNSSKVILYSSSGEKVNVLVGKSNIEKEAIGLGGGNFSLKMPVESDVKEGDPIVIPSISPNVFSVVERVEFKETDSFETVLFKNPVNLSELEWVEVLKK